MYPVLVGDTGTNQTLKINKLYLYFNSSLGQLTANSFNSLSDYRIKENVVTIYDNNNFTIDNLRPVTYTNKISGKQDMGFIAHELQEHYPFLVSGNKDGSQNQSVNYIGLIALLVKEIQELKKEIRLLKS